MSAGARGTIRDGKEGAEDEAPDGENTLIVVNLTNDVLNGAIKKIEDGLLGCIDKAVADKNDAALIRLHVHLSKIAARPKARGAKGRTATLSKSREAAFRQRFGGASASEDEPA